MVVNRIAIPQQVGELVKLERVPQLLAGLFGGWVAGHVEVEDVDGPGPEAHRGPENG